jgi:hypothetical protein
LFADALRIAFCQTSSHWKRVRGKRRGSRKRCKMNDCAVGIRFILFTRWKLCAGGARHAEESQGRERIHLSKPEVYCSRAYHIDHAATVYNDLRRWHGTRRGNNSLVSRNTFRIRKVGLERETQQISQQHSQHAHNPRHAASPQSAPS